MAEALKITNLHKSFKTGFFFKQKKILKGISLTVDEGEIFGYLGPNGAGKTTTLKCIMGLIFPDAGEIEILGQSYLSLKAKKHIGFLPENPYFYDYLTANRIPAVLQPALSTEKGGKRKENSRHHQAGGSGKGFRSSTQKIF